MTVVGDASESGRLRAGGWQVSLGGLIVLVLAAGIASWVARSARGVWGWRSLSNGSAPSVVSVFGRNNQVALERTAGLMLEIADVFLLVIMARGVFGLSRRLGPTAGQERNARVWSIAWRIGATCFLLWFLSEESRVLRIDLVGPVGWSRRDPGFDLRYCVWQGLYPVCGLLAILGLALGMGAGFLLPSASTVRRRPYWLFVVLGALIAILLVAIPHSVSLIPYLVLHALEAVNNAMQHRLVVGPGLSTRLIHAGIDTSVAAALCLALALAVARDFERLRRGEPWTTSRMGRVVRFLLVAAGAAGGLTISLVTIPAINRFFAQGLRDVIGPGDIGMIVGGFGLLAAGMTARTIVGPPPGQPPVWRRRLSAGLGLGFLGLILLYALCSFPGASMLDPTVPPFVSKSIAFCHGLLVHLSSHVPDNVTVAVNLWFAGEVFPWTLMTVAVVAFVLELAIRPASVIYAPFDRLAESPGRARPFVWLVLGLTVVCLSALPILIVAGQVILHLRMTGAEVLAHRWAN